MAFLDTGTRIVNIDHIVWGYLDQGTVVLRMRDGEQCNTNFTTIIEFLTAVVDAQVADENMIALAQKNWRGAPPPFIGGS